MKTRNKIIAQALLLTIFAQSAAYADTADIAEMQSPEPLASTSAREIMGGSIVSNDDGSVIRLECVQETGVQGECAEVQFIHQTGIVRDPLTAPIEYAKFVEFYRTFSTKISQAIESHQTTLAHMTVMPLTKKMFSAGSGDAGWWAGGLTGGAGFITTSAIASGTLVFAATWPLLGLAVGAVIVMWPVDTDVITLPYRGIKRGINAIAVRIKNRRMRKHFLRTQKDMLALVQEGNRSIKLNGADFNALLEMFAPAVQVTK